MKQTHRIIFNLFLLSLLALGQQISRGQTAEEAQDISAERYHPRRIVIKPKVAASMDGVHAQLATRVYRQYPLFDNIQVVELPPGLAVAPAIDAFQKSGSVHFAQPDYRYTLLVTPNDPYFNNNYQWGHFKIDATNAWDLVSGAPKVVVAILDTGVNTNHTDLQGNLWINPAGGPFRNGINAIPNPPTGLIGDDHGHGTTVAGVVGAVGNNTNGVCGTAWQIQMMICKWVPANGISYGADLLECLDFAILNGANIINCSFKTS